MWRLAEGASQAGYLTELRDEAKTLIGEVDPSANGVPAEARNDPAGYSLLLEIEPGAAWIYRLRGDACIRLKLWDQAVADAVARRQVDPDNPHLWYGEAAGRLGTGDLAGYQNLRKLILARFRDTKDPRVAAHLCYACAVLPAEPMEAKEWLRFAEFAVQATPGNPRIRGAMNYRAGNHMATIADLDQSASVFPRRAWDWLFLAMAHSQLGHAEEAKKCLKSAEDWIELAGRTQASGTRNPWFGWYEPLEVSQLHKEARALIRR
jgi:tetratricopeptide (TPR) repeat protein